MQYVISPSPDNLLNKAQGSWRRIVSSQLVFARMIHMRPRTFEQLHTKSAP